MATTTAAAIRTAIAALVDDINVGEPGPAFREHRYDQDGDFIAWAEAHPDAAPRRYSVRLEVKDADPALLTLVEEWREALLVVLVAYPKSNRFGVLNALGLDDAMRADQMLLEAAIGVRGGANLAGIATLLPRSDSAISWAGGESCDFLIMSQRLGYWASADAY
jgi:hypothetical protein